MFLFFSNTFWDKSVCSEILAASFLDAHGKASESSYKVSDF